mgnify:CR=1 FL=1
MKNLKFTFLFCALFGMSFSLSAQFNLGVKAGLNFTDINVSDTEDPNFKSLYDSKSGYHVGAFLEGPITPLLGLRGEALFSTKGASNTFEDNELNLDYLSVPLMLKIKPLPFWAIHAGGEFGFKLDGDRAAIFDDHKTDIGWAFGTSLKFFNRIGIEARYLHGTTNLGDGTNYTDINGNPIDVKFKNRSFQVSLEYYFTGN